MKQKSAIVSILLGLVFIFTSAVSVAQHTKFTIGLSVPSQETGFFNYLIASAQTAAGEANAELKIVTAEFDPAVEVSSIQSLIDEGVSAILIYPIDYASDNLVSTIEAANAANIPVFILGKDINRGSLDLQIASVLSPNNDTLAGVVGKSFCDPEDSSKSVVILKGIADGGISTETAGDANATPVSVEENSQVVVLKNLVDGLSAYMAENCATVPLEIEDSTTYDNADSLTYFDDLISNGTDIGGVFVTNTALTNGLLDEVLFNDLRDLKILTSDISADTLGALETESIAGIIAPEPTDLGKLAVEKAVDLLGGESVDANTDVALVMIDASTAIHYRADCPFTDKKLCKQTGGNG